MRAPEVSLGHLQVFGTNLGVVHDAQHNAPAIVVELQVRDVHHGGLSKVLHRTLIDRRTELQDRERFKQVLRECVVAAFAHEVDEWLRVDGELVTEPHR